MSDHYFFKVKYTQLLYNLHPSLQNGRIDNKDLFYLRNVSCCSVVRKHWKYVDIYTWYLLIFILLYSWCGGKQFLDEPCTTLCPVDCRFSSWGPWGPCDSICGPGLKNRTAKVTNNFVKQKIGQINHSKMFPRIDNYSRVEKINWKFKKFTELECIEL